MAGRHCVGALHSMIWDFSREGQPISTGTAGLSHDGVFVNLEEGGFFDDGLGHNRGWILILLVADTSNHNSTDLMTPKSFLSSFLWRASSCGRDSSALGTESGRC